MQTKLPQNKKQIFHTVNGDLFDVFEKRALNDRGCSVIIPHVCNNIDIFGGGFAAAVANRFPIVKENYHMLGKAFLKNNFGHVQFIEVPFENKYKNKIVFANMICQNGLPDRNNRRCINYATLVKSMSIVSNYIKNNTNKIDDNIRMEIHAPKFGSGIAGGNWNFISELIIDIWHNHDVFIYNYNNKK
jgi:hypothetical protein